MSQLKQGMVFLDLDPRTKGARRVKLVKVTTIAPRVRWECLSEWSDDGRWGPNGVPEPRKVTIAESSLLTRFELVSQ